MFCTSCGRQINDNIAFCTGCGKELKTNTSQSVSANNGSPVRNPPTYSTTNQKTQKKPIRVGLILVVCGIITAVLIGGIIVKSNQEKKQDALMAEELAERQAAIRKELDAIEITIASFANAVQRLDTDGISDYLTPQAANITQGASGIISFVPFGESVVKVLSGVAGLVGYVYEIDVYPSLEDVNQNMDSAVIDGTVYIYVPLFIEQENQVWIHMKKIADQWYIDEIEILY